MNHFRDVVSLWLLIVVTVTGLCGLMYVTVQQNYRMSLNDPQIQMAEDAARLIGAGVDPSVLAPKGTGIEISESLAPWIAVYDKNGVPLGSSGLLHGIIPKLPDGVLDDTSKAGEDRLTWEPEAGVRQAIVVTAVRGQGGYVVAGRNMREVEGRESSLGLMILTGWLVILIASFFTAFLESRI